MVVSNSKDHTKFLFKGEEYGKGRLVLAVISDYVERNSVVTYEELKRIFPDHLQGSQGVFSRCLVVKDRFSGKANNHHFMKPNEIISLVDGDIAVCVDWSVSNIYTFIDAVKRLDIAIEISD